MLLGEMGDWKEKKKFHEFLGNSESSALSASYSSVVAVCVEKNSQHTVKWALHDLISKGDELMLIHVRHPIVAIPTPMGNIPIAGLCMDVVTAYMESVASETRNLLWSFQQMCNSKKVQAKTIVLEHHDVSKAILEYISNSKIRKLVVGSSHNLIRKLKGRDIPTSIAKQASKFCDVYVIAKSGLVSVHPRNTSAQSSGSFNSQSSGSSNSEYALTPRGEAVLERSHSNRHFDKIRRNLETAFVSKPSKGCFFSRTLGRNESAIHTIMTTASEKELSLKFGKLEDTYDASDGRFRRYSMEQIKFATDFFAESLKIGEGGYGPVYKASLDHTTVAIKVLQADTAQGRDEFQREIEILSRIHHPNMVMLLGACPERGCLVYEYMENGSLEDQLFHRGERDSLPWFIRFRIASEIATALHFLHSTTPEPIIHRDLKPANILIDHNFVSKIGDVGLAKLIPPPISCALTEYKMTGVAGTFYYMDPEYVRTRKLFPACDVYALGIIFLQLLTARSPMGIIDDVEEAIKEGSLNEILDKTAGEWPLEESQELAELALKCTELRRQDRPDMKTVILPKLERLRDLKKAHAEDCIS